MFPDIEAVVIPYLEQRLGVWCAAELPHEVETRLPMVRVHRTSGQDYDEVLDRPIINVDVYAATRPESSAVAERARDAIRLGLRNAVVAGAVITDTRTVIGPRWLPDSNSAMYRFSASYLLAVHPDHRR